MNVLNFIMLICIYLIYINTLILDIATALIEKCTTSCLNICDKDGRTPLMYACMYGDKTLVEYLLHKGSIVNVTDTLGESPLLQCISNFGSSSEMLRCLLDAGADVSEGYMITNYFLKVNCPYL